jgi:hypothetical protein
MSSIDVGARDKSSGKVDGFTFDTVCNSNSAKSAGVPAFGFNGGQAQLRRKDKMKREKTRRRISMELLL